MAKAEQAGTDSETSDNGVQDKISPLLTFAKFTDKNAISALAVKFLQRDEALSAKYIVLQLWKVFHDWKTSYADPDER